MAFVVGGGNGTTRLNPTAFRLTSPAELDLTARLSGMRLKERWGEWSRTFPYLATSRSHISFCTPEDD